MKNKIIYPILFLLTLLSVLFVIEKIRFPVSYVICGQGYTDCFTSARFKDMQSCQFKSEQGSWLCDSHDPKDIKCEASQDSTVVSYCN